MDEPPIGPGSALILGATLLLLFGGLGISWSGAPVVGLVLVIGLITYGARGVFWATLADCDVPDRVKGLAIGSLSLICYAPDVIQPLIEASLLATRQAQAAISRIIGGRQWLRCSVQGSRFGYTKGFNVGNLIFKRSLSRTR